MRKSIIAFVLLVPFALLSAAPVSAATTWEELVEEERCREIEEREGSASLDFLRRETPKGTELDLWHKLWVGETTHRAAVGVALMDRIFPDGDPGRWEEADGFLGKTGYRPRQLAGLDAFFVTIAALDSIPGGTTAAAVLMRSFSKSARGMIYFIENMPQGLQEPIASIVAKTRLRGDWTARKTGRPLPLLPVFGGVISRNSAESRRLVYLDGAGRIAGNGYYAWDRERGCLYQVVEDSERFWRNSP